MSTLFSKIISREIHAHIIYEDEYTLAFLDIHPTNPGHTLVIPKEEKPNMLESSPDVLAHVWKTIQKIKTAILKATNTEGCIVTTNVGEAAGQSVFHTHFHIIPRKRGDGLALWPQASPSQEELSQTAQQIKFQL
jgi:histidine triad (HIT) family protein